MVSNDFDMIQIKGKLTGKSSVSELFTFVKVIMRQLFHSVYKVLASERISININHKLNRFLIDFPLPLLLLLSCLACFTSNVFRSFNETLQATARRSFNFSNKISFQFAQILFCGGKTFQINHKFLRWSKTKAANFTRLPYCVNNIAFKCRVNVWKLNFHGADWEEDKQFAQPLSEQIKDEELQINLLCFFKWRRRCSLLRVHCSAECSAAKEEKIFRRKTPTKEKFVYVLQKFIIRFLRWNI